MNILFITGFPVVKHIGGVQRVTDILAQKFISQGHNTYYLSYKKVDSLLDCEYTCEQFYITPKDNYIKEYPKLLKEKKIDLIINQMVSSFACELLKLTPSNIKVLSAYHSLPFYQLGKEMALIRNYHPKNIIGKIYKFIAISFPFIHKMRINKKIKTQIREFNEIINLSDRLCLLSEHYIPRVLKLIPDINKEKLTAINNPNTFNISELDLSKKENIVICAGRIEETIKNMIDFIKCWKVLYKKNPNWKAYIIGGNSLNSDLERLKKYVKKNNIQNFYFTGRVDNIQEYYNKAKIIIIPSIVEGWPMVLTEAMSYGCVPCVYNSFEAVKEIIEDGKSGIIVPFLQWEEMANKIQSLINDDKNLTTMAKNAHDKVRKYESKDIAQKWIDMANFIKK